ncbi:MAG: aminopeptidase N, partial [Actinobacteria bacterium]
RDAELPARRYLRLVLNNATDESEVSVVQSLLRQASAAAVVFGDPRHRDTARGEFARAAEAALRTVEPASDYQLAWARAFVGAAREPDAVAVVRALLDGTSSIEGLAVDTDLRWHMVVALASAGLADDALIDAEAQRDPTDEGLRHATTARAARPTEAAKAAAWAAIVDDHSLPLATMEATMAGFQQPDQEALLAPYAARFFDALAAMWQQRVPEVALSFAEAMYPVCVPSDDVVAMTDRHLGSADVAPPIHRLLLEGKDQVERVLRTRARDAADS